MCVLSFVDEYSQVIVDNLLGLSILRPESFFSPRKETADENICLL
jgi:hypothetical protein